MLHFKEKIILIGRYYDYLESTGKEDNPISFIDFLEDLDEISFFWIYEKMKNRNDS